MRTIGRRAIEVISFLLLSNIYSYSEMNKKYEISKAARLISLNFITHLKIRIKIEIVECQLKLLS